MDRFFELVAFSFLLHLFKGYNICGGYRMVIQVVPAEIQEIMVYPLQPAFPW